MFAIQTTPSRFTEDKWVRLSIYCTETLSIIRSFKFELPFCSLATDHPSWAFDSQKRDNNCLRMIHASQTELYAVEAVVLPEKGKMRCRKLGSLPRTTSCWTESSWAFQEISGSAGTRINVAFGLSNAPPVLLSYPVCETEEWLETDLETC